MLFMHLYYQWFFEPNNLCIEVNYNVNIIQINNSNVVKMVLSEICLPITWLVLKGTNPCSKLFLSS